MLNVKTAFYYIVDIGVRVWKSVWYFLSIFYWLFFEVSAYFMNIDQLIVLILALLSTILKDVPCQVSVVLH